MASGATARDMSVFLQCSACQAQKCLGSMQRQGWVRSTHDTRKSEGFYRCVVYVLMPAGRANFLRCKELAAQCPPAVARHIYPSTMDVDRRKQAENKSGPGAPNAKKMNKLPEEEVAFRKRVAEQNRRSIAGPQGESHRYERHIAPEGDATHGLKSLYPHIQCGLDVSGLRLAAHALAKKLDYLRERIAWQLSTHRDADSAEAWASVSRVLQICPEDLKQVWEAAAV